MPLKPEVSLPAALATATIVYGIHTVAVPPQAALRETTPGALEHKDVSKSRRQATWISGVLVSAISLMTKDQNIFIVGGSMVIVLDWWTRYNNQIYPAIGRVLGVEESAAQQMTAQTVQENVEPNPYGHLQVM